MHENVNSLRIAQESLRPPLSLEYVPVDAEILNRPVAAIPESEFSSAELIELAEAMHTEMKADGIVGLTASQLSSQIEPEGIDKRLFVMDIEEPETKEIVPITVINGRILEVGEETRVDTEGCASAGDIVGRVIRPSRIRVEYFTEMGEHQERWLEGFDAQVFQHEHDHTNGIRVIDYILDDDGSVTYAAHAEMLDEKTRLAYGDNPAAIAAAHPVTREECLALKGDFAQAA